MMHQGGNMNEIVTVMKNSEEYLLGMGHVRECVDEIVKLQRELREARMDYEDLVWQRDKAANLLQLWLESQVTFELPVKATEKFLDEFGYEKVY